MSKPRPKFCVGEEVIDTIAEGGPKRTEIVEAKYRDGKSEVIDRSVIPGRRVVAKEGWTYRLAHDGLFTYEKFLKKLPPQRRTQWSDCEWQPTREGIEA